MNNKTLNREFIEAMKEKNRYQNKTGFTDSEDDETSKCKIV